MERIPRDHALMMTAALWSQRGTCSRAKVGAVFSRDGRILVQGYNGAPAGMPHCEHLCDCGSSDRAGMISGDEIGVHLPLCAKLQPCRVSVHAEANGIAFAAKYGVKLEGAILHTTLTPCTNCAMLLINCGINSVIWGAPHRDMGGNKLLLQAGISSYQIGMI